MCVDVYHMIRKIWNNKKIILHGFILKKEIKDKSFVDKK